MSRADDDEIFEQSFPSPEALRPYIGKVVAFDAQGVIRAAADSWEEIMSRVADDSLTLLFVPGYSVIA